MKTFPTRLAMIAALPPGTVGAEIGVQRGVFSREILNTPVERLHLVDAWRHLGGCYASDPADIDDGGHEENLREVQRVLAPELASGRAVIHRGLSREAAVMFGANDFSIDWAYLDAGHGYDAVLADLLWWSDLVKTGGCLMGHDYLDTEQSRRMGFGVVAAVTDFCRSHGWRMTAITEDEWPSFKLERA